MPLQHVGVVLDDRDRGDELDRSGRTCSVPDGFDQHRACRAAPPLSLSQDIGNQDVDIQGKPDNPLIG